MRDKTRLFLCVVAVIASGINWTHELHLFELHFIRILKGFTSQIEQKLEELHRFQNLHRQFKYLLFVLHPVNQ